MHPKQLSIKDFSYHLPEEKIARYPSSNRDESKLLVFHKGEIQESTYRDLSEYIPSASLLIFNQTKVINARLIFKKPTGGRIEIFCLEPDKRYNDIATAMQEKNFVYWHCMVGGSQKWKEGQLLSLKTEKGFTIYAQVMERVEQDFIIKISWDKDDYTFADVLQTAGQIPLPPYLKRDCEEDDIYTYQTLFAKDQGSVAAPTAALHFTPAVFQSLQKKNCKTGFVTLHVGAGTFQPVKSETMDGHNMHAEWMEVSLILLDELIHFLKNKNKAVPLIAVGTTSCRTIESLYWIGIQLIQQSIPDFSAVAVAQWFPYENKANISPLTALKSVRDYLIENNLEKLITRTQIIIAPGYQFKLVDALITNFHQPQSTLLLLVSALVGDDWKKVYEYALQHAFRFLSYGDGCLLWKK